VFASLPKRTPSYPKENFLSNHCPQDAALCENKVSPYPIFILRHQEGRPSRDLAEFVHKKDAKWRRKRHLNFEYFIQTSLSLFPQKKGSVWDLTNGWFYHRSATSFWLLYQISCHCSRKRKGVYFRFSPAKSGRGTS